MLEGKEFQKAWVQSNLKAKKVLVWSKWTVEEMKLNISKKAISLSLSNGILPQFYNDLEFLWSNIYTCIYIFLWN